MISRSMSTTMTAIPDMSKKSSALSKDRKLDASKSMKIDLHSIFRYLTSDEKLLSVVIDNTKKTIEEKSPKKSFNMMESVIIGFIPLSPGQLQSQESFPTSIRKFFTPFHSRMGVKNITNKNMTDINISFLNSLNMLLRKDLAQTLLNSPTTNMIKDVENLEEFIKHKLSRNAQIDKVVKNTVKIKQINNKFINELSEGKINQDLIQYIVNLFEINLLVFNFIANTITLYWAQGKIYPFLNFFKDVQMMSFAHGNFEPIIYHGEEPLVGKPLDVIYANILLSEEIKPYHPLKVGAHSSQKIMDLKIPTVDLIAILKKYTQDD